MVITNGAVTSSLNQVNGFLVFTGSGCRRFNGGVARTLSLRPGEVLRNYNDSDVLILNELTADSAEVKKLVNYTDEELIGLITKQDHDAFSELVRRYSAKFYSTAYRILMNKSDSEDMVQEAFLKIWNEPELWDKRYNTKFTTWFYRVIINQCLDYRRKKSYRNHDEYTETASSQFDTGDIIENKSKSDLINNCIKELPERQQIALNLFYYENLSINESAEIMELKPKGMESLVLRAKKNLKNRLREYHEQEAI